MLASPNAGAYAVNANMLGASSSVEVTDADGASANRLAIQRSIDMCPREGVHQLFAGDYVIDAPIAINRGFITLEWMGRLVASDNFVGEYMVTITYEDDSDYYRWPLTISQMFLDCRQKTRGLYAYAMDHESWSNIRVENSYGRAIAIDRMRESTLFFPTVINSIARQNFADPSDWNSATAYVVGDKVRVPSAAWDIGTAYVAKDIVAYASKRYIALKASTGSQPDTTPLTWKQIPYEDYVCVVNNTNKAPSSNNTNASSSANRVWQKIYQDEACIEVVDYVIDGGDRTNQVTLFSPIVRDSTNLCYVRVDSSKTFGRPVTHFNIVCGHIHGIPSGQVPAPPNLQRQIEIGYAVNTNIYGSNIRSGDGTDCIGIMIGDSGTTKVAQNTRLLKSFISGDGANDLGILVMPSTIAGDAADFDCGFSITHATSTEMFDPSRTLRHVTPTEQIFRVPPFLSSTAGGVTVEGPASPNNYATIRPFAYRVRGDAQPRLDWEITNSASSLRFGAGGSTSPDVTLRRANADILSLVSGDSFQLESSAWNTGRFLLGTYNLWVDGSGRLRIKNGTPTSDTDGTVVGTQT